MSKELDDNLDENQLSDEVEEHLEAELLESDEEVFEAAETVVEFDATDDEMQTLLSKEGLVGESLEEEPREEIFVEEDTLFSLLESILFANPKPLTFDAFKQIFKGTNIKTKQLRKAIEEYAQSLASSTRGVYLEEVAGGFQLRTKLENTNFLKNAVKQRPFKISGASLEVMAILAYKQPCIKAEVDNIRGVESGHLIRVLMDKGLVAFDGKSDLPGKPMLYKTTKKFLEVFGLRNIRELPSFEEIEQLIPEGIEPPQEKKTLDSLTGELSLDYARRDQEAEEELVKISDQLSDITTTSDFFEKEKERARMQKEKDRADDIRERILLDQEVEQKDVKWLKRYEEKLIADAQAAANPVEVSAGTPAEAVTDASIETVIEALSEVSESEVETETIGIAISAETTSTVDTDITVVTAITTEDHVVTTAEPLHRDEAEKEVIQAVATLMKEEEIIVSIEGSIIAEPVKELSVEGKIGSLAEAAKNANALFDDDDEDALDPKNKLEI